MINTAFRSLHQLTEVPFITLSLVILVNKVSQIKHNQTITRQFVLSLEYRRLYSRMAMGMKDVLRYSMISLCRNGGKVAKVEIMV